MASVTFDCKIQSDSSLSMPRSAIEKLGLQPGDDVRVQVEPAQPVKDQHVMLNEMLADLLAAADVLESRPGPELIDPDERAISEMVRDKFRRMGLKV